jgi:hypothetical protein
VASDPHRAVMLAARGVGSLLAALIAAGVFLAPFWTPGIFLTLGAVVALFALQLGAGIVGYRHVMSRPWPQVPALEDDDDW